MHERYSNRALLSGTQYYILAGTQMPQVTSDDPGLVKAIFPNNR